jgi:hypothetical protein
VTRLSVFAFAVLTLGPVMGMTATAQEKEQKQQQKEPVRHVIGVPGVGLPGKAIELTSAEDFASVFGPEALEKVKGQVDFSREKVVYVGWEGSGSSSLRFSVVRGCRGLTSVAIYVHTPRIATTDNRIKGGMIVMPRGMRWTFGPEAGPERDGR